MNKLFYTSFLMLSVLSVPAFGQDEGKWEVDKNTKKIVLPEATRNFEKVSVEPPQVAPVQLKYEVQDVDINLPKLTTKINVIKLKEPDIIRKFYGNYVKAGFGNYTSPYLEGFFNNKRNQNYAYGLHLKHFSSKNGPVDNSGLSQNQADGYVRYFTKAVEFTSRLGYQRNRYNFYGYNQDRPVKDDTLKNLFSTINFMAGIRGNNTASPFSYDLNFNYYNFSNSYYHLNEHPKAKENEYLFTGGTGYKLDDEKAILADVMFSASSRTDSFSQSRNLFQLKPAFQLTRERYKLLGGLNFAYGSDTLNGVSKVHIYPRVHVEYSLVPNLAGLFAGLNGEMQRNTFRTLALQNPFLAPDVMLAHTNKSLEIYGGIQGNFSQLNYKAKIGYSNYKNLYFFNNSVQDSSRFDIFYDNSTSVLNLEGDLGYEVSETFRFGLNMNYYNYNTSLLDKPYHRPNFVSRLSGTYNLYRKIYFNADIYYISGLIGKNLLSGKEYKLDNIFDLSLKADYRFSNVFSAFLEVNNILSKKYQRYLYYPVKGINVVGGIAYSF